MTITQYTTSSCCGGKGVALVLSNPLTKDMLAKVLATGKWAEAKLQTAAGMFYVENQYLVAFGPFNKTSLELKCKFSMPPKNAQCQQHIDSLIALISV